MKAPIKNKASVLETLEQNLHICEVVVQHSIASGHTPDLVVTRAADLREAIRFITEHAE